jgi:alpha-beta hydrolase superfamily lysophospholipase
MWLLKRWKSITLVLVSGILLFALVGLPYLMTVLVTRAGTRPMDLDSTESPSDYGLEFEEVTFPSMDGVPIGAWFLGGGSKNAVIACGHGLFRSRREVLDRAAFFRELGFDTLVLDFRRHGTSGGERVTLGYQERLDFEGAIRFLRERRPGAPVVLYGVSMGAAAALLAARETPEVAAVIADSSFLNVEHTVVHHVKLFFGLPRFPIASELLWFLERRGGFDRRDFDLEAAVAAMGKRPVMIVAGGEDRRMPLPLQRRLFDASSSPKSRFVPFDSAGHGSAFRVATEEYRRALIEFLDSLEPGGGGEASGQTSGTSGSRG